MTSHRMTALIAALAGAGLVASTSLATAQSPRPQPASPTTPAATRTTHGVTDKAELEAFLDGVMATVMPDKHIAGAVVSVVKDGSLFFAKGYGYADIAKRTPVDPARTLFRIGSVSKLFTWTAVMQQVEAGKLDLDADVNRYLDFKIPATFPRAITLRHMMSHSAGFEEDSRGLLSTDSIPPMPRGEWLRKHMPARVREPGTYSAYSNYATALAGYIVERVSSEPWEAYIERHILQPLDMTHTTGRQPLPAAFVPDMSVGYSYAGGKFEPKKFEFIFPVGPAGAISSTATDMAKFMLAHLGDGAVGGTRILGEATARLMHTRSFGHDSRLPGWDLGFYEKSSHGLYIYGHGGDTQWFHSDLSLFPTEHLGLFLSFNTNTGATVSFGPFLKEFVNHYYPTVVPIVPTPAGAVAQAHRVAGEYQSNRRSYTTFQKSLGLSGATRVVADSGGSIVVNNVFGVTHFVPIGPLLYREETGEGLVAFKAGASGRIERAFFSENPTDADERLSWYQSPRLHLVVLGFAAAVFIVVIAGAISRFFRRRLGRPRVEDALPGRWLIVSAALVNLVFVIALAGLAGDPLALLSNDTPALLKVALALPIIAAALSVAALVTAVMQWLRNAGTPAARLRYDAVVVLALLFVWSLNQWNLLGWSM